MTELDEARRRTFAGLADVLIPAGGGLPSASGAGAAGKWLDEVLRVRPDLRERFAALLDEVAGEDPQLIVERLRTTCPDDFAMLAVLVPGAYFLNPEIRAAFGYAGQEAVPIDSDIPPDYLQDGLLESVISRGPVYRPTDSKGAP